MQLDYSYDGFLPVTRTWSGEIAGEVRQHFDENLWLTGIEVNGETTELDYNPHGLLTRAGALTLDHDPISALLSATELGPVTTEYAYNVFGEPVGKAAAIAGTPALALDYQRDALGRLTQYGGTRYEYTANGELKRKLEGFDETL